MIVRNWQHARELNCVEFDATNVAAAETKIREYELAGSEQQLWADCFLGRVTVAREFQSA